jgi:hypothetical protein
MTLHREMLQSETLERSRGARGSVATLKRGTLHGVRGAYCVLRSAAAGSARADKGASLPSYADGADRDCGWFGFFAGYLSQKALGIRFCRDLPVFLLR